MQFHCPASAQNQLSTIAGLGGFLAAFFWVKTSALAPIHKLFIVLASLSLTIILIEFFCYRVYLRSSTGLDISRPLNIQINRVLIKLWGLSITLILIALCYWAFPIYQRSFYTSYWIFLGQAAPYAAATTLLYFVIIDSKMQQPKDGYWHAGRFFLLKKDYDPQIIRQFFLVWIIKAFFLALMIPALVNNLESWESMTFQFELKKLSYNFNYLFQLLYSIDLAFIICGYLLTCRLFDTHVRSADPTFFGWGITLICYQPFWSTIYNNYLRYDQGLDWQQWLSSVPWAYMLWAVLIILLTGIYAWSSVCFGLRFSNLTHRGIITHGPYRWSKHPAYISKNLSWWLISIPFINFDSITQAFQQCCFLAMVNLIYYWRAKTEERHLLHDPVYQEYAQYIAHRGLLARLTQYVKKATQQLRGTVNP